MQDIEIKINKSTGVESIHLSVPDKWNELSPKQFLYVSNYWLTWKEFLNNDLSLFKARGLLFLQLTGLNARGQKKLCKTLQFINPDTALNILDTVNFLFGDLTLTKNIFPWIRVSWFEKFYGPSDNISDLTILEFSFAYSCYSNYIRTNDEQHLDKLIAILYRPKNKNFKTNGEIRIDFNNRLIPLLEKKTKKISHAHKQAVFLFFKGCLEHLAIRFPVIFQKAENNNRSGGSFIDTVVNMSGGKFGPFDTTKNQNLYIILRELQEVIIAHKNKPGK